LGSCSVTTGAVAKLNNTGLERLAVCAPGIRCIETAGPESGRAGTSPAAGLGPGSLDCIEYRVRTPQGVSNPVLLSFATAPVVTEQEPNDRPDQAQKVPLPREFVGQFYPPGDRDWLTFEAEKGGVYWIELFSHRLGYPTAPFALVQRVGKNDKGEETVSDLHELYASDANIGGPEFNTPLAIHPGGSK